MVDQKFLAKDGTLSPRAIRKSLGTRKNRKEGTKATRKPGSKRAPKVTARTQIRMRTQELQRKLLEGLAESA